MKLYITKILNKRVTHGNSPPFYNGNSYPTLLQYYRGML